MIEPISRGGASLIRGRPSGSGDALGAFSKARSMFGRLRPAVKARTPNLNTTPGQNPLLGAPQAPQAPQVPFAPPPAPQVQYPTTAQVTQINPADDLRSKQITPTAGPSRSQIALQRLKSFDMDTEDKRRRETQQIGRDAAGLGRLNSGMVTTDLGSLEERLQRAREQMLLNLSADTAEGEIGDARFDRDELRTERGFQSGAAQQGQENRIRQIMLEDQLLGNQFGRDYDRSRLELGEASGLQEGADSAIGGVGELLKEVSRRRAAERAGTLEDLGNARPPVTLPSPGRIRIPQGGY